MNDEIIDGRRERGFKTKEKILLAALELLAEEGAQKLSASKLAQKAGVSKSNLFHHFRSVNDIPLEAMKLFAGNMMQPVREKRYERVTDYLHDLWQIGFGQAEENLKYYKGIIAYIQYALHDERYRASMAAFSREFTAEVAKQLGEISGTAVSPSTLNTVATLVVTTLDGMGMHYLVNDDLASYHEAWQALVALLEDMLTA